MKTTRTISLDVELNRELRASGINVSDYCEKKLWDYVTNSKNKENDNTDKKDELLTRKEELETELGILDEEDEEKQKEELAKIEKERIAKDNKIKEVKASLLDFYQLTETEALTLAETYYNAKQKTPDLDFWGYFTALNLPEQPDEETTNNVFGGEKDGT